MQHTQPVALVLPRGLILLASVWLIVSWLVTMGLRAPVEASSASYTPGVRVMLVSVTVGLMIGWPLLRLSQPMVAFPVQRVVLDLVVLVSLVQVVLWPLRLVTPWTTARTALIDATMVGWAVLAGAFVASALGSSRGGPRTLGMAVCVAMCIAGPLTGWIGLLLGADGTPLIGRGPLVEIHVLSGGGSSAPTADQWRWVGLLAVAALAAWTSLAFLAQRAKAHAMRTANTPNTSDS